ncbi:MULTISPECIES: PadR family transcriptional regulator [Bacillaceae]|uniref:PadR family transcriptional regulator n=1 Tax=Evansella alkalicola TaxID=745819 RepID=A0ABS6JZ76_9BACI|nr:MULTISPECIES: PadR family transcriptional regulator [Bacillaceae]MBU9723391.1 PadR family transcriptional regulator [Bacillus alkalicola]
MNSKNLDWNNQLSKGMFELAILLLVSKKPMYGYEITKELQQGGVVNLASGSIYPILRRLTNNGWIKFYQEEHEGRSRKYYHSTKEGDQVLKERYDYFQRLNGFLVSLKEGDTDE